MDSLNASDRLRSIVDFLLQFPTREQLVVFLSENVCPKGEIAGVSTGYLDGEGNIIFEYFYGYKSSYVQKPSVKILEDDPSAEILRTMKTKIINLHTLYETYSEAMPLPGITDYGTGLGFPTTSRRIYVFAFVTELDKLANFMEYFECLRSILTFWETLNESKILKTAPKPELLDSSLTKRQTTILDLINEGKTNVMIAVQLGYSESLIRQETIIIYRKLGVDGRRELKKNLAS